MPTIDVEYAEFEKLLGLKLKRDIEKVNGILASVKGEVKLFDDKTNIMIVEIKDTNRPDIWNVEGLARALRGFLGLETGLKTYSADKPVLEVQVDARLESIRPYIGCSVIKGIELTDSIIRGFMHLQDKLDQTYGRNRQRTSIGLYDFSLIRPPLRYTVAKPTEISFIPLGFEKKMDLKEILQKHPKGLEYGHIVNKHPIYPILLDSDNEVLSFPPIVNSNNLGKITDQTENVLIEVTGTASDAVNDVLRIVTLSLIDRGGRAYAARVHYPEEKPVAVTPRFETRSMTLNIGYVNKIIGLRLTAEEIAALLPKAGYDVNHVDRDKVKAWVPCYRVDVMHAVDLVEDIAIAYGYDKIEPLWRRLPTTGSVRTERRLLNIVRELMVGLGFQETMSYTMTNHENMFAKMNCTKEKTVEIANPKIQTLTCLRSWLLPSLMEFLSSNTSVEYPQRVFELGIVTLLDDQQETRTRDEEKLAAVVSHANAGLSEIKSDLDALFLNLGLKWRTKGIEHPSFIKGRTGTVTVEGMDIGVMGEVSPQVLTSWKLENPAAAFELNMERLAEIKHMRTSEASYKSGQDA